VDLPRADAAGRVVARRFRRILAIILGRLPLDSIMSDRLLTPRPVSPDSFGVWRRQAWALIRRRPFAFAAVAWISLLLLGPLPGSLGTLARFAFWPFFVGAFVEVARAADRGEDLDPFAVLRLLVGRGRDLAAIGLASALTVLLLMVLLLPIMLLLFKLFAWTGLAGGAGAKGAAAAGGGSGCGS
jgi:hypothetical protein